jgi:Xaa-Pro aminopeptidase
MTHTVGTNGITDREVRERQRAVRAKMTEHDVDVLLVTDNSNIRYLTNAYKYSVEIPGLLFPVLIVTADALAFCGRNIDTMAVAAQTHLDKGFMCRDDENFDDFLSESLGEFLAGKRLRVGIEMSSPSMPIATYERLRDDYGNAHFVDATRLVWSQRAVKSPAELKLTRAAAAINKGVFEAFCKEVVPGTTDRHLRATLFRELYEAGSYSSPFHELRYGQGTIEPHGTGRSFNAPPIAEGDRLIVEFSADCNGYIAPILRSIAVGDVDPEIRRVHAVALAGLEAAMGAMRPGVLARDVDRIANELYEREGFRDAHLTRSGYAVGLDWPEGHIADLNAASEVVLEEDMVFHVLGILFPPNGTGVGISESVRVTSDGVEVLNSIPRDLIQL